MGSLPKLFLGLSTLAAYSMYYFAFENGLIAELELAAARGVLPGRTHIPLVTKYTKIPLLDVFLRSTVIFFWPVARGLSPSEISAYGCAFAGGMAGVWVLWTLENAHRYGPVSALVRYSVTSVSALRCTFLTAVLTSSRTTLHGIALQVAGPGLVMPLLLGWDLLHHTPRAGRVPAASEHLAILNYLPTALLLGSLGPILGAALLCPTVISFEQSQMMIAFWQGWPIWTTVLTLTLSSIRRSTRTIQSPGRKETTSYRTVQILHAFAFACAASGHWILCINAQNLSFLPHLASLLLPRLPWFHARPSSISEGVLWFLQWDYSIAATAVLIWSVALWRHAVPHGSVHASRRAVILPLAGWFLVSGPCGAAIALMWKRQSLLFPYRSETYCI